MKFSSSFSSTKNVVENGGGGGVEEHPEKKYILENAETGARVCMYESERKFWCSWRTGGGGGEQG